jgi:hypothetical protein
MCGIFSAPAVGNLRGLTLSLSTALTLILSTPQLFAATVAPRLTWLLPKTVLDATIVYTYQDCTAGHLTVKITPTLTPRAIPDLVAGQQSIFTDSLEKYFQDNNISVLTLSDSHLLSSLGSAPSSQVTQIASNVLGGITKLVAIGLGTQAPVDKTTGAPPPVIAVCSPDDDPNSAQSITKQIKDLKKTIQDANAALAKGGDDAAQKKNTAAIQAAQNLITTLQDQISITIKTTIDPGISSVLVDPYGDVGAIVPSGNGTVNKSGLVATICPSVDQLKTWFANSAKAFDGIYPCQKEPMLEINVYMDVLHGSGTMYDTTHKDDFEQTALAKDDQYRDAAHIPVNVWRGKKMLPRAISASNFGGPPSGEIELVSQIIAFGQFGVAQRLPVTADIFKSLTWSVTFSQSGETLAPSFSSKALAANATSFFGNVATAANSIATEQRTAASSSTEANASSTQADAIYEQQRLKVCLVNPANCPSK